MNLKAHPFSELFPIMSEKDFEILHASIAEEGLREKIVLYQGKILDGRNRYSACIKAKVKPAFAQFKGTDKEAMSFVFDQNFARRHLTDSQRACCAAERMAQLAMPLADRAKLTAASRWHGEKIGTIRNGGRKPLVIIVQEQFNVGQGRICFARSLYLNNRPLFEKVKNAQMGLNEAYKEYRRKAGSKPKFAKGSHEQSKINIESSRSIVIPEPNDSDEIINEFITKMISKGWRFECKIMAMIKLDLKMAPIYQGNWYGNGFMSNKTSWCHAKSYDSYKEALLGEAHNKLDCLRHDKMEADLAVA